MRLINADVFKDYCHSYFDSKNDYALRLIKKEYGTIVDESIRKLVSGIDELPTADVEIVKHGKWIKFDKWYIKCSSCGEIHDYPEDADYKYCPNCGTKMDGIRRSSVKMENGW